MSSLLLRPAEIVLNEREFSKDLEMQDAMHQNRISGLAMALLTLKQKWVTKEIQEKRLYARILDLNKYQSSVLQIINYEDNDLVVNEQFNQYAEIYRPIIFKADPFKHCIFETQYSKTSKPGFPKTFVLVKPLY